MEITISDKIIKEMKKQLSRDEDYIWELQDEVNTLKKRLSLYENEKVYPELMNDIAGAFMEIVTHYGITTPELKQAVEKVLEEF